MSTLIIFNSPVIAQTALVKDHFKKVVVVVFENSDYSSAIAQPDFKKFTQNGVLFTNLSAETHPSQGNYIAMIAGSNLDVTNDNIINLKETHLGDLLENANLKWKVYAENYPGKCFTGMSYGAYVRKHVPFMSFIDVTQSSVRCLNIEDETNFFSVYKNGLLSDFSMYIPNLKNDGHDTGVDFAGKWLAKTFGNLLAHPQDLGDVLFILTFDEGKKNSATNQIFTVIIGKKIKAGSINSQKLSHAGLLKLIEDEYGIGNLGRDDLKASMIEGLWN